MTIDPRDIKQPTIEVLENENGRTVIFTASRDHGSFSLRPILRDRNEAEQNGWSVSELSLIIKSGSSTAWHMQATVFTDLTIEDINQFIAVLTESRDIMKKHEEVCYEKTQD